jgi:hypothetical protein
MTYLPALPDPLESLQDLRDLPASLSPSPTPRTVATVMLLPPEATYSLLEELKTSINAYAAQYRFAFRTGRSTSVNKKRKPTVFVANLMGCGSHNGHHFMTAVIKKH